jgi:tetratricopeptide (TPR) repeat protein
MMMILDHESFRITQGQNRCIEDRIVVSAADFQSNENGVLKALAARLSIARMAYENGSFAQSAKHYQLALSIIENSCLPEILKAGALLGLAKCRAAMGEFNKAESLLEKVVLIDEADTSTTIDEAEDLHQLSLLYWRSGRFDLSFDFASKAYQIASVAPDCPDELTAKLLKHFAVLAEQMGKLDDCERYLHQAIEFIEDSSDLGRQSSIYGDALLVKVLLLVEQNRLDEAVELYPHAIQVVEFNRGPNHPHLKEVLSIFRDFQENRVKDESLIELRDSLVRGQL